MIPKRSPETVLEQEVQGNSGKYTLRKRSGQITCNCPSFVNRGYCWHTSMWEGPPEARYPRKKIQVLIAILSQALRPLVQKYEVAGSFRRLKPEIRDVDILVSVREARWPILKQELEKQGMSFFVVGDRVMRGTFREVNFDIYRADKGEWAAFLLFLTGSGPCNIRLRAMAKKKGFKLNQYGLFTRDSDMKIPTPTEASIFKELGLMYIAPENREQ